MCSCVWCFATCDKRAGKTARSSNRNRIAHRENSTLSMWLIVQQSGLLALLELLPKKPNCTRQTGCSLYQINFRNKLLENEDSDQFSRSTHSVGIQKNRERLPRKSLIDYRRPPLLQSPKLKAHQIQSQKHGEKRKWIDSLPLQGLFFFILQAPKIGFSAFLSLRQQWQQITMWK